MELRLQTLPSSIVIFNLVGSVDNIVYTRLTIGPVIYLELFSQSNSAEGLNQSAHIVSKPGIATKRL